MNCIDVTKSMQLFLDEELPFQQVETMQLHISLETMQLHISSCNVCNQKLQAEKAFKTSLRDKIERKHIDNTIIDGVRSAVNAHALA
jgi:hypothetical protein